MLEIHSKYDFSTLAAPILGVKYKNMKVLKLYGYDDAVKDAGDLATTNVDVFTDIGSAIVDHKAQTYVAFETANDKPLVLSTLWIDQSSIKPVGATRTMTLTISDVNATDEVMIPQLLRGLNYTNFTYTVT